MAEENRAFWFRAAMLSLFVFTGTVSAQAADGSKSEIFALLPADTVTRHRVTLDQGTINYTARAGTLTLRDATGQPSAKLFYVAYTQDGMRRGERPVTFFFNGGPGAGSAYLNLGAAGPRSLRFPIDNPLDGANAKLVDNLDTWLPATDMVFVDAIGTGYSRPLDEEKAPKLYYGINEDASALAKAVQLWVGQNGREESPHYLVGESYGGVRSIQVADALQQQQNLIVNGIILISPEIEVSFLDHKDNPLASAMLLPSFIAAHLEELHQLTPKSADDAYHYAFGPYLSTLVSAPPTGSTAEKFYADIAVRTGIPEVIVAKEQGLLDPSSHDVRSRDGQLYESNDFTQSFPDPYPDGVEPWNSPDAVISGYGRAYGNAFSGYVARDLGFKTELTYNLINMDVYAAWNFGSVGQPVVRQIPVLRKLLAVNPSFRVFVANGYFDMACPFSSSRWIKEHIPIGGERISLHVYRGGHMLYARPSARTALWRDVSAFYVAGAR